MFVEGHTEKYLPEFFRRWIDPKTERRIRIITRRFNGVSDYLDDFSRVAEYRLREEKVAFIFGLLDLYGLPDEYALGDNVAKRVANARSKIEGRLPDGIRGSFKQHFAVHETEAWLLSDPSIFGEVTIPDSWSRKPESINMDKPPAKQLKELFAKKKNIYKKTTHARILFPKLDPEQAASKCPHLKAFLDDLLKQARKIQGVVS
ncbi:MAG: DUF4276 family protein [Deltaproteobacteria bacterium]|nr:DUF4276 family protein [Deltaproteobacteria bacterium]